MYKDKLTIVMATHFIPSAPDTRIIEETIRGMETMPELDGCRCIIGYDMPAEQNALLQNFPNPFNPETWIPYQLKDNSEVTIKIFDANGGLVRELALGYKLAGIYTSRDRSAYWDGKDKFGISVACGIYFYSIHAGDFSAVGKMMLQK